MEKTIYIVKGYTGEWDGAYEWEVKAFFNKDKAESLMNQLNVIAEKAHAGNFGETWGERDTTKQLKTEESVEKKLRKLDPKASVQSPGTNYSIKELTLEVDND